MKPTESRPNREEQRRKRQAAALRANLKRRKEAPKDQPETQTSPDTDESD